MKPAVHQTLLELRASRQQLWPFVSETDRINRLLGSSAVSYRPNEDERSAARFVGETSVAGFKLVYDELPFEWETERGFRVTRLMRGGPLAKIRYDLSMETRSDGGTNLSLRIEVQARTALVAPLAWLAGRQILRQNIEILHKVDDYLATKSDNPFLLPVAPSDQGALGRASAALIRSGTPAPLVDRLAKWVTEASDADVMRIRPFECADAWNEDPHEVLVAMLHGVIAGLFELRFSLLCPSCNTAASQVESLALIEPPGHCGACDIRFDIELDRAVEATLVPHPSIRKLEPRMFCIGGPGRTPHVLAQQVLAAGQSHEFRAPTAAGRYRIFARGGAYAALEVVESGVFAESAERAAEAEHAPACAAVVSETELVPGQLRVSAGQAIQITNQTAGDRHVKLERIAFADRAVTAQMLTNMPEFRKLFSADLIKPKTPLKVARVALLFSDLTGSTALYADVGDAAAFRFVDDHFDVVTAPIASAGGVIVKTMGDAVMASFDDLERAVGAALAALSAFDAFAGAHVCGKQVGLKLGVYAGPCYVISANERLDYFGQTVNVAARLQGLANSGEVVMLREHFEALSAAARSSIRVKEAFATKVKGVPEALAVVRLVPAASTPLLE